MAHPPLNFDRLKDDDLSLLSSDSSLDALDDFEALLSSSFELDVDATTATFIAKILARAPKEDPSTTQSRIFRCGISMALLRLASSVPADHKGQEVLLRTTRYLIEDEPTWKGFGDFGMTVLEQWGHAALNNFDEDGNRVDYEDERQFTLPEWQNANYYMAKLNAGSANGIASNFGLWEIRLALENSGDKIPPHILDARLRVACVWLTYNSRHLLQYSLQNLQTEKPLGHNSYHTGPKFHGSIGYTLERWGFWKRRLIEIRKDTDESVGAIVDGAVKVMSDLELEVMTKGGLGPQPYDRGETNGGK